MIAFSVRAVRDYDNASSGGGGEVTWCTGTGSDRYGAFLIWPVVLISAVVVLFYVDVVRGSDDDYDDVEIDDEAG